MFSELGGNERVPVDFRRSKSQFFSHSPSLDKLAPSALVHFQVHFVVVKFKITAGVVTLRAFYLHSK